MKTSRREFLVLAVLALAGCATSGGQGKATDGTSEGGTTSTQEPRFAYRFAGKDEAAELLLSHDAYYEGFNQLDIDFRLQRKGGTLDELKAFAAEQTRDFTEAERQVVTDVMAELERLVRERGVSLPDSDEIVFAKTTMAEECYPTAYTHGTQIYLMEGIDQLDLEKQEDHDYLVYLLAHEVFHCLTRSNPDFRAQMYAILGFEIQDEDFAFGPSVREVMLSNPDVEHHNASAMFTLDGEQRRCAVVFYSKKPFEKKGDSFFDTMGVGIVPADDLDTLVDSDDVDDFWEVFGQNTYYVIDPEEAMAENFGFAIAYGREGREYASPEIIDRILGTPAS